MKEPYVTDIVVFLVVVTVAIVGIAGIALMVNG